MTRDPGARIISLAQLRRLHRPGEAPSWHAMRLQPELNGGKLPPDVLLRLADAPEITALTASGVEQKTLELLCSGLGARLTALHFWKCPRIVDLTPLEAMPQLTHVAFYWNQKTTRLWNLARTPALRGLHFDDFTKLRDLSDLAGGEALEELAFGNAIWSKFEVDTLEPLSGLARLRTLAFNAKAIGDGRIQPLAALTGLESLGFPSGLFETTQLAWLRAHLPASVASDVLQPFLRLRQPLSRKGRQLDVLVSGKRKPFLSSQADDVRLRRHVAEFEARVRRFEREPTLMPEDLADA